jgi:16S rRNA (guanine1207-N2)-methyltransferase
LPISHELSDWDADQIVAFVSGEQWHGWKDPRPMDIGATDGGVIEVGLRGHPFRFLTAAGVFSKDRLDTSTDLLAKAMEIGPQDRTLDPGCGYAPIGVVGALLAFKGTVCLVDANLRAVKAARENLALNGIDRGRVVVSDGFADIDEQEFSAIVTNPPFQSRTGVGCQLIQGAGTRLLPGGRMLPVAVRSEGYRRRMQAAFGDVQRAAEQGGDVLLSSEM